MVSMACPAQPSAERPAGPWRATRARRGARAAHLRVPLRSGASPFREAATEPLAGRAVIRFSSRMRTRRSRSTSASRGSASPRHCGRRGNRSRSPRQRPRPDPGGGAAERTERRSRSNSSRATSSLNRNPDFMYTLFVPARAHLAFPCFDQPDLKARWTLALDVPAGWQALANGAETARVEQDGRIQLRFAETRADLDLPVRVRRGQVLDRNRRAERPHVPHVPPRDRCRQGRAQPRRGLRSARDRARAGSSTTPGSPIRSASSTSCWCRRSSSAAWSTPARSSTTRPGLLLDQSATQNQKLGRASVIAHETAHMWFGDLVTMRVVQRRVDEGGLRQLHGGEDRQPVVPRDQPRAAVSVRPLPVGLRGRPHAGHQRDPPGTRQPGRGGQPLRRRSSTRRRRS